MLKSLLAVLSHTDSFFPQNDWKPTPAINSLARPFHSAVFSHLMVKW